MRVRLADPTLLRGLADFLESAGYIPLAKTSETIEFVPPAAPALALAQADFRVYLAAWALWIRGSTLRWARISVPTCPVEAANARGQRRHSAAVDDRLVVQPERRDSFSELGA
jgi:hypothetical protein